MLVPMAKVEIIGPKNLFFEVLSLLHDHGQLHIEDLTKKIAAGEVPLDQMEVYERQGAERDRMDEALIRVRAVIKALHRPDYSPDPESRRSLYERLWALGGEELMDEVAEVMAEVEDRTSALASAHTSIEAELALLARYEPILHKVQPLARQIVTTGAYDSVALLVERRYKAALEGLKDELGRITKNQCEIVSTDVDEETTAAIVVFARAYSEPVHRFLSMENVNQIRLPTEFQDMPFDAAYDALKVRRKELPGSLSEVSDELSEMSAKWMLRLTTVRDVLIDRIDEIAAIPKFGRTEYAFVINGWVPVDALSNLRKEIARRWGDEIIVEQHEIREEEFAETPVALRNPKAVAPFQSLLSVYGVPRYGTVDPTWMIFLFYPLFFGMIVGDTGYGLVMLGVIVWLRRRFREKAGIQIATAILGPAATMAMAFGLVYGEAFGNVPMLLGWVHHTEPAKWFGVVPTFHRTLLVQNFMYVAVAVGVVQVVFGLILGIVNAVRTKHRNHLYEKAGILAFLLGILIAVGVGFVLTGPASTVVQGLFALVAAAGFVFALRGGKFMGAIEMVESISHIASYIRIMAVGLAGAIFADAVNQIVASTGNFVLGAAIALVLHGLNFIIAAFSPTIHALRLNFLEFFGKFYETGKQQYSPFTKTGGEKGA